MSLVRGLSEIHRTRSINHLTNHLIYQMLGLKPNVPIPTSPITIIHSCHCLHLQCVRDPFTDCNLDNSESKVSKNVCASNYNEQNILPYCTFVSRSAAKLNIECERRMVGRTEDVMPSNILDTKSRAFPFCSMNKLHMFQGLTDISNVKRKDQLILSKLN